MKTEVTIKLTIKHDTAKLKHVALNMFCDDLKENLKIDGVNGLGECYELTVTKIVERPIK